MGNRTAALLFFLTGAVGLVYQTVWMRMLIRVFGVTVYATTTVVAVFMAGLALGALLGGRFAERNASLRAWGVVEGAAGVSALLASALIAALPGVYASIDVPPSLHVVVRVALAAACLLPPTMLMGATLPLLVAALEPGRPGRAVALLYGVNTLGAVVGVLAVGFAGIAVLGESGSIGVAVTLQLAVALAALVARAPAAPPAAAPAAGAATADDGLRIDARLLAVAAAVAGAGALACEIAWTRLLVFVVGSSVYGFSSMLAMYLLGIAAGSLLAPRARTSMLPGLFVALGVTALLSLRAFLALGTAADGSEYLYSPLREPMDVLRFLATSAAVVAPLTFVSGMVFPLIVAAARAHGTSAGRAVGWVYTLNTFGAVAGALLAGFGSMPVIGAQGTVFAAALLFFAAAAALALAAGKLVTPATGAGFVAAALALGVVAPSDDVTRDIVARRLRLGYQMEVVRHTETIDTTVTVAVEPNGRPTLLLNGIFTSTKAAVGEAMAHLPLVVQEDPQRALVICFGVGSTFAAAAQHVPRVDAVELVEEVVASFPVFHPDRAGLIERPGTRVIIDDGRNFLLRSRERYDVIIIDGAPPIYSAGFVNLYSKELIQLARDHLTDTGVLLVWVPTLSFRGDIWSITRALTDVFPHSAMWTSTMSGYMLMGSASPFDLSREHLEARIAARGARVPPWFTSELLFEKGRFLDDAELRRRAAPWQPVTDDRPTTEYPLGRLLRGEALVRDPEDAFR